MRVWHLRPNDASRPDAATILYVTAVHAQATWRADDDDCLGPGFGTLADPYCAIQLCIDNAANGAERLAEPGIYYETINFNGKATTLRSTDGPDVAIIDGTGLNDSVVKCVRGERAETVLQGFTITGGVGTLVPSDQGRNAAGVYGFGASPTFSACVFEGNTVMRTACVENLWVGGGAMGNVDRSPRISGCTFNNNASVLGTESGHGGAMLNEGSSSPSVPSPCEGARQSDPKVHGAPRANETPRSDKSRESLAPFVTLHPIEASITTNVRRAGARFL